MRRHDGCNYKRLSFTASAAFCLFSTGDLHQLAPPHDWTIMLPSFQHIQQTVYFVRASTRYTKNLPKLAPVTTLGTSLLSQLSVFHSSGIAPNLVLVPNVIWLVASKHMENMKYLYLYFTRLQFKVSMDVSNIVHFICLAPFSTSLMCHSS